MFPNIKKAAGDALQSPVVRTLAFLALASTAVAAAPDPADLIADASTNSDTVMTLVKGCVGFFLGVKLVKWIRK